MCILLNLDYAKFGVSNLFLSNVIEEKPLGVGSTPQSLVKEGLKDDIVLFNVFTILVNILIITNENKCASGSGLLSWFL